MALITSGCGEVEAAAGVGRTSRSFAMMSSSTWYHRHCRRAVEALEANEKRQ